MFKEERGLLAAFFENTSITDYYPPIDSFVIDGAGIKKEKAWSTLNEDEYQLLLKELIDKEGRNGLFRWELENWEKFSKKNMTDQKSKNNKRINDNKISYSDYLSLKDRNTD